METKNKSDLITHYESLSTDELIDIQRRGTLTELASEAMQLVLEKRGIKQEEILTISKELNSEMNERLASLGNRFVANLLDNLIALALSVITFLIFQHLTTSADWIAISAYLAYYFLSDGLKNGQSFGKRMMKIGVIEKSGRPCGYMASFIRNLSLLMLQLLDVVFIFGKSRKRLGDHAASTEVINLA